LIEVKCEVCGKPFSIFPYRKNRKDCSPKYCSMTCRNKAYKGKHFSRETEFKLGQQFSKDRNLKVSFSNQGRVPVNKGNKRDYNHICKYCGEEFVDKRQHNTICPKKECQFKKHSIIVITPKNEEIRRRGISKALKGKIPLNLRTNFRCKGSPRQKALFEIIKKYFPSAEYNYPIQTSRTKRFLDVGVSELKIDFEYNGKCHLLKSVIEHDKQRTKELTELGWKVIVFDRTNFAEAEVIIKKIKEENRNLYKREVA
jgi:very-short-patch-repair endonuclease